MTLAERLAGLYSGAVYDVLRAMGRADCVLPSAIAPVNPAQTLAGPVFTVSGEPDSILDAHESLLLWTGFLSEAPSDAVVVCQPNDSSLSHMGELSAETLQFRGICGYIVDGGCRDVSFILERGFPVWCRYYTPRDIVGRWAVRGTAETIQIGGVTIDPDDYVIADRDGVVVIPHAVVEDVVVAGEEVLRTENLVRSAILRGQDPQAAYLEYGKF